MVLTVGATMGRAEGWLTSEGIGIFLVRDATATVGIEAIEERSPCC